MSTAFQSFMDNATGKAMDVFSSQTLVFAGHTIRCDLAEEQEDIENAEGGKKRITIQMATVQKSALPAGVAFSSGGIVTIDGTKKEIQNFHQDEITYSLVLVVPRQGK